MQSSLTTYRCPHCNHAGEFENVSAGDSVTCPAPQCGKEFRAKLPEAEPEPESKLIVPGDQNQTGAEGQESKSAEAAAFSHESDEQQVVATYQTPVFRRHPFRSVGCLALILLGLVGLITAMFQASAVLAILSLIPLGAGAGLLAYWWWQARNTTLTLTTKSLVVNNGMVSDHTREIHLANIQEIHIYQTPMGKLLDTGALLVEWGDDDHDKIYLDAVRHPHEFVKQIRELAEK